MDGGLRIILLDRCPRQARVLLRLSGADVERFLQGIVSADVAALPPGHAAPATLLTVKGKIISELIVLRAADGALALAAPADVADEVEARLDRHIIMDDVSLTRDSSAVVGLIFGPGSLAELPSLPPGALGFRTQHPAPGLLVVGPAEVSPALTGVVGDVDPADFTAHRVATASPAWGFEIRPDKFPPEVGFTRAVSYDKGCYMGQEPLARIHARGQVNRVMVRVRGPRIAGDEAVGLSTPTKPNAGLWTTRVDAGEGADGLAIVHRKFAAPGTRLAAGDHGEVEVRSGPLGDDLGVGDRHAQS